MSTDTQEAQLGPNDRCDACGSQAYMRATLPSGSVLLFCAHHGRMHRARLEEMNATILDETERLAAVC